MLTIRDLDMLAARLLGSGAVWQSLIYVTELPFEPTASCEARRLSILLPSLDVACAKCVELITRKATILI